MTSNIYLAAGFIDDLPVMKVGKANVIERRQRQIGIAIELFHECADETQAFYLERRMRWFMSEHGAVRVEGAIDWFMFDHDIYQKARTCLSDALGIGILNEYDKHSTIEDIEIAAFQRRYRKMTGKPEPAARKTAHQTIMEHRRKALDRYFNLSQELKDNPHIADAKIALVRMNTRNNDDAIYKATVRLDVYIDYISQGYTITGEPYDEFQEAS